MAAGSVHFRRSLMSINPEQIPFRPVRRNIDSVIASAIRFRIYRFASACRRSRIFWPKCEQWVQQWLGNPVAWPLVALIVSSIGLYYDLR
jgi:hypothetical protein